jgi:hypothetical protein
VPHENCLMFVDGTKTWGVSMMTRRKLERMSRMSTMNLTKASIESVDMPCVITQ